MLNSDTVSDGNSGRAAVMESANDRGHLERRQSLRCLPSGRPASGGRLPPEGGARVIEDASCIGRNFWAGVEVNAL